MRTHDGYDARDSYERAEDAMGENVRNRNDDIESNGRRFRETPSEVAVTMRSLIKAQEEQHQLNVAMLQILTIFQWGQAPLTPVVPFRQMFLRKTILCLG